MQDAEAIGMRIELFGELPDKKQLADFNELLGNYRCIPPNFVRDIIMKKPSRDIMNAVARSVLMLYAYDDKADDTSVPNVVRQSLQLISELPLLAVYSYQAYRHFHVGGSLIIHEPDPKLSTAENILHLLRADGKYTSLEAEILDIYKPRCNIIRNRYVFNGCIFTGILKRSSSRRCKYQGQPDV